MDNSANQPPFKAGLVGAGGIARVRAEVITNRLDMTEPAAVCDPSPDALQTFRASFNAAGQFADLDEMLSERGIRHGACRLLITTDRTAGDRRIE